MFFPIYIAYVLFVHFAYFGVIMTGYYFIYRNFFLFIKSTNINYD